MKHLFVSAPFIRGGLCAWVVFQILCGSGSAADAVGNPAAAGPPIQSDATDLLPARPDFPALDKAKALSPKERIAAVDAWLNSNGSAFRDQMKRMQPLAKATADVVPTPPPRTFPHRSADEQALDDLTTQFSDAIGKMRAVPISPRERIRNFDEFLKINREAFSEVKELRQKIASQRAASASPRVQGPVPARTPEEAAVNRRSAELSQEIATYRAAINQLSPAERIATVDRDQDLLRTKINELLQLRTNATEAKQSVTNPSKP